MGKLTASEKEIFKEVRKELTGLDQPWDAYWDVGNETLSKLKDVTKVIDDANEFRQGVAGARLKVRKKSKRRS